MSAQLTITDNRFLWTYRVLHWIAPKRSYEDGHDFYLRQMREAMDAAWIDGKRVREISIQKVECREILPVGYGEIQKQWVVLTPYDFPKLEPLPERKPTFTDVTKRGSSAIVMPAGMTYGLSKDAALVAMSVSALLGLVVGSSLTYFLVTSAK
jgi:hypothetical protein